jgi:uncharacterized protein YndB with AHSA1/START domain
MNMSNEAASGTGGAAAPGDRETVVERVFNAPRDVVWQAFTTPALVAQWWGRGNKLVVEELELRPGGRWRFVEHTDGGVYGFEGRYCEIAPPGRLVSTFTWDGMTGHAVVDTTTFEDLGDGRTKVIVRSLFDNPQERDAMLDLGMETGLAQSYAALDRLLAETAAAHAEFAAAQGES